MPMEMHYDKLSLILWQIFNKFEISFYVFLWYSTMKQVHKDTNKWISFHNCWKMEADVAQLVINLSVSLVTYRVNASKFRCGFSSNIYIKYIYFYDGDLRVTHTESVLIQRCPLPRLIYNQIERAKSNLQLFYSFVGKWLVHFHIHIYLCVSERNILS